MGASQQLGSSAARQLGSLVSLNILYTRQLENLEIVKLKAISLDIAAR
jgi:homoserine kinase